MLDPRLAEPKRAAIKTSGPALDLDLGVRGDVVALTSDQLTLSDVIEYARDLTASLLAIPKPSSPS